MKIKNKVFIPNLPSNLLLKIYRLMVKSRVLEERLIQIYRQGQAYFWIGSPGEEAFGVPLGLLVHKGKGIDYDFLHLHYRATPTLIAMGLSMKSVIRLIMNKATDSHTGGRNFVGHYCVPEWNVTPTNSVIETQYSICLGTALIQSQSKKNSAISIVTGGDAGTAEGDFATCLIWSSRPERPLPILITVQNNKWGISTAYKGQHGETHITDRGKAFNMDTALIDGNDPIESYTVLKEKIDLIRKQRKPILLEALVSRLYGHSSSSGANYVKDQPCCIARFERTLFKNNLLSEKEKKDTWDAFTEEAKTAQQEVRKEKDPDSSSIWKYVYAHNENADWRQF